MLYLEERGRGPRLALVHGFTQSGRAWGPAGDRLAERFRLLALDAPGHGRSAGIEADLPGGADLMAEAVDRAGGPAAWLGYSMGGRFALHVALQHPHLVTRLVLVSATAGIDDATERADRRRADGQLADRIEAEGLEPFLRTWLAQPLFASLPPEAAQLESRLDGTAAGLASSLRRAGTGTQEPLWDQLVHLRIPVLVVVGRLDGKYLALAGRLVEAIGTNAELEVVEGAGHACHLEQSDRFSDAVTSWLAG
ncbi:MAG TPA: alpha/beta fold hydrolase [Acidimicrobiales bacterium]|jgi:2-succinyl-6-hydroxy-2,4-cyclohexadiene-1-carboxylate synthase|nr:alpha/beta fold hydrolase [Acidimicrobiales bacterium]